MHGGLPLDKIFIDLIDHRRDLLTIEIDVYDTKLSRKWLTALNHLLANQYHLEKNYCFLGFTDHKRNGWFIVHAINRSIAAINHADLGYHINDYFCMPELLPDRCADDAGGRRIFRADLLNKLHRYFEDLQGTSGHMSPYWQKADCETRWHIRQLNLLCHELESWALSYRKKLEAPEWQRPSQLMCWLNAPRFVLDHEDHEHFGIECINKTMGGVYLGVNKAVGKNHWEVFNDEGADSTVNKLTTTTLRSQTEAAGDFDIEWSRDTHQYAWQQSRIRDFRSWLERNGFDPDDKALTLGHPKVAQVDLTRSFGTDNYKTIWKLLNYCLDVRSVKTSDQSCTYDYNWSDFDYPQQQIAALKGNRHDMVA